MGGGYLGIIVFEGFLREVLMKIKPSDSRRSKGM